MSRPVYDPREDSVSDQFAEDDKDVYMSVEDDGTEEHCNNGEETSELSEDIPDDLDCYELEDFAFGEYEDSGFYAEKNNYQPSSLSDADQSQDKLDKDYYEREGFTVGEHLDSGFYVEKGNYQSIAVQELEDANNDKETCDYNGAVRSYDTSNTISMSSDDDQSQDKFDLDNYKRDVFAFGECKNSCFYAEKSNCQQLAVQQLEDDNNDEETFDYSEAVMSCGTSNTISISSDDDQSQDKFDLEIYQRDVFAFGECKNSCFYAEKSNCQQLAVQQLEDDNNDEETFDYSEAVMSCGTSNTISISSDDDQSQDKFDLDNYKRDVFAFGECKNSGFYAEKSNCQQLAVQQLEDDNNDEETFDYSEAVMSCGTSNTISISSDDDQSQDKFDLDNYKRDVFAFGECKNSCFYAEKSNCQQLAVQQLEDDNNDEETFDYSEAVMSCGMSNTISMSSDDDQSQDKFDLDNYKRDVFAFGECKTAVFMQRKAIVNS